MVVRLPEMKKYLNRDGLEEYNSLLPHSSTEIEEYVADWLDAHPEATTTVQDGAITERKLADKSVSLRTLADDTVHMLKGAILTGNLSGKVLAANDAYSAPPIALTVEGKSTQDGTPTTDTPIEIVNLEQVHMYFAGLNMLDLDFVDQYTIANGGSKFTANGDGTFTVEAIADRGGSKTVGIIRGTGFRHVNINYPVSLPSTVANGAFQLPAGTYTFRSYSSNDATKVYLRIRHGAYNATTDGSNNVTFTTDGAEWCQLFIYVQAFNTLLANGPVTLRAQLEANATATPYQPYEAINELLNLTQALHSLPDGTHDTLSFAYLRASTREGWAWFTPTQTRRCGQMNGYNDVSAVGNFGTNANGSLWYITPVPAIEPCIASTNQSVNVGYCSICQYLVAETNNNDHVYCHGSRLYIRTAEILTDSAAAITWTNAHKPVVVYKLNTPITTQLDPIELPFTAAPNFTIWSDPSTELQIKYVRDANIVIQNIEQAIADL